MSNSKLYDAMLALRDDRQAQTLSRFFKTGKGEYGEGDRFLGIKVPVTRGVVKELWRSTTRDELLECLTSPWHELRLAALLTLIEQYRHSRDEEYRSGCIELYLDAAHGRLPSPNPRLSYVDNWDLVDLSCYCLLGDWLLTRDRGMLGDMAGEGNNLWVRRIGMVSTMAFLRHGELDDTYTIADIFLLPQGDGQPLHDLLQKATGWLLREAGKRDTPRLTEWLQDRAPHGNMPRAAAMPRTMLRYAIERLPETTRKNIMTL
ncbi:MAG: DNA alkylation repair protein [Bacteroidales bacterium]|nr:DNA alkylation repair protein [Bacteroidales bacterium]